MKRKLSVLIGIIMLCSLFTVACNKVPTAQELVDNAFANMSEDKANLTMEILMEMSTESEFLGENVTMTLGMDMDMDVQSTLEVGYVSGEIAIEMFGMEMNQKMESYTDVTEGVVYTLSEDVWYKTTTDMESVSQPSAEEFKNVRAESFIDLVLVEEDEDEESTEWVVTGVLDYSKIMELMGEDLMNSLGSGVDTDALGDLQMQVVMTFDKETQTLQTMKCTCDEENLQKFEMEGGSIDVFEFVITFHDTTDLVVEIPAEVKENAVEGTASDVNFEM